MQDIDTNIILPCPSSYTEIKYTREMPLNKSKINKEICGNHSDTGVFLNYRPSKSFFFEILDTVLGSAYQISTAIVFGLASGWDTHKHADGYMRNPLKPATRRFENYIFSCIWQKDEAKLVDPRQPILR